MGYNKIQRNSGSTQTLESGNEQFHSRGGNSRKKLYCEDYEFVKAARKKYKKHWNKNFTETHIVKLLSQGFKNNSKDALWLVDNSASIWNLISHHKFYIEEHKFTRSITENHDWKTELSVKISLKTIKNNKTLFSLKSSAYSKAGFIVYNNKWKRWDFSLKPKKTVKEGERRASSKILDEMNSLIKDPRSESERRIKEEVQAANKFTDKYQW